MDKHELQVHRAEEASRVINSPLFAQAFEDTRRALLETWASLDRTDGRYQEHAADLHRQVKLLDKVRRCLETHIDTGKLAVKEIEGRSRLSLFRRA